MALNNNAKNEILKAIKTLTKAKIIEAGTIKLDPTIIWGSQEKTLSWSVANGMAISSFETYVIDKNEDPNALYLKSEIGKIKIDGSVSTTQVENVEDAVINGIKGKRGYNGTYSFVARKITNSQYQKLVSSGRPSNDLTATGDSFNDKTFMYTKLQSTSDPSLSDYRGGVFKLENDYGIDYALVLGREFDEKNYDNESTKYEMIYQLADHHPTMQFLAKSTISTKVNVSMIEQ